MTLKPGADAEPLRTMTTVVWESTLLPIVVVAASEDQVRRLCALAWVERVEPPRIGSFDI